MSQNIAPEERKFGEMCETQGQINASKQALVEARLDFEAWFQAEKDPIKKAVLFEYHRLLPNTKHAVEIRAIKKKAALVAETARTVEDEKQAKRKLIKNCWLVGIPLVLILIATGFDRVHYYTTPLGQLMESKEYRGPSITLKKLPVTVVLAYSHVGYGFTKQVVPRVVIMLILFCAGLWSILQKFY